MTYSAPQAISGKNGSVIVGSDEVASVGNWTQTITNRTVEIPIYGTREMHIGGKAGGTGMIEGARWLNDAGQIALRGAVNDGEAVFLQLYRNETSYIAGYAIINSFEDGAPHDSYVPFRCNYIAVGEWTDSEDSGS